MRVEPLTKAEQYKRRLPLSDRIRKLGSKMATNGIRHYLECSPIEWSIVENSFYKDWLERTMQINLL